MKDHPLKVFRETKQLSPAALARLLEVSRATVSRWESGDRLPDRRLLQSITEKTGISARELRPDLAELLAGDAP